MLRALSKDYRPGVDLMILGVTSENIRRLCDGEPILAKGETFGKPDADVLIVYAPTIGDVQSELVRLGFEWPDASLSAPSESSLEQNPQNVAEGEENEK